MTKLEERANDAYTFCETERENAIGRENTGGRYFPSVYRSGYIKGATEQREIDIAKACESIWDIVAPYVHTAEECEDIQSKLRKIMEEQL